MTVHLIIVQFISFHYLVHVTPITVISKSTCYDHITLFLTLFHFVLLILRSDPPLDSRIIRLLQASLIHSDIINV